MGREQLLTLDKVMTDSVTKAAKGHHALFRTISILRYAERVTRRVLNNPSRITAQVCS